MEDKPANDIAFFTITKRFKSITFGNIKKLFCECCGKNLEHKPKTYNFDHILEKGNKK